MSIEFDTEIDKFNLDEELMQQVSQFGMIGDALTEAEHRVRVCEQKEKEIRSKIILEVHQGIHDDHFDGKPTAQGIEAFFRVQEDHIHSKRAMIKAQKRADDCRQKIFGSNHKRNALELLVKLYLTGYYGSGNNESTEPVSDRKRHKRRSH